MWVWRYFPAGVQNLLLKAGVLTVTVIIQIIILAFDSKFLTVINAGGCDGDTH